MITDAVNASERPACLFSSGISSHIQPRPSRVLDLYSREEKGSLTENERRPDEILICEGHRSSEASLKVSPFEDRGPFGVTQLVSLLCRIFNLSTEHHVFVFDIVALDISDESFERASGLVMLFVRAEPGCGS